MEQKLKFIIIGLIGFLVLSVFLNLQTLNSKNALQREKERLSKENSALEEKFNRISRDYQGVEAKVNALTSELDRVAKEKEDLQNKYAAADKAREELTERLKSLKEIPPVGPEVGPPVPQDAYWAGILKDKKNLELQLENIRSELRTLKINNEELQREKGALELEVNNVNLEKQDLKRQLEYNQKQLLYNQKLIDNLTLELVGEKNDKLQVSDNFKSIKNENTLLRRHLKSLNNRKISLEKKLQELQEEKARIEKRFSEMDILLKDRTIQIETLRKQLVTQQAAGGVSEEESSSVELPPIIVRPLETKDTLTPKPAEKIKVMAVNKDNNFVIIDSGKDSGIKLGDTFNIYRNKEVIASVEVVETRETISACDIKKETTPIKVGDTVR